MSNKDIVRAVTTIDGEMVSVAGGRLDQVKDGRVKTRIVIRYPAGRKLFDGVTGFDRKKRWRIHPDDLLRIQEAHPTLFRPVLYRWTMEAPSSLHPHAPLHRYLTGRSFVPEADKDEPSQLRALVVLLHPTPVSANETNDEEDATLRRLITFARREKWNVLEVSYLFSLVAEKHKTIRESALSPIGPEINRVLAERAAKASLVVAAWGGSIPFGKRQKGLIQNRDRDVVKILRDAGHETVRCFAHDRYERKAETLLVPPHPLNIPAETPLTAWEPAWT